MPVVKEWTLWPSEEGAAFKKWILRYHGLDIDCSLTPFLNADQRADWLQATREALMLSQETVAKKMNVSANAYAKLEKNEPQLSIKLATLKRAAAAMDCELIYAIRPKCKQKFSWMIWRTLLETARKHPRVRRASTERKAAELSAAASDLIESLRFRIEKGWTAKLANRRSRGR